MVIKAGDFHGRCRTRRVDFARPLARAVGHRQGGGLALVAMGWDGRASVGGCRDEKGGMTVAPPGITQASADDGPCSLNRPFTPSSRYAQQGRKMGLRRCSAAGAAGQIT
jgi:hypothetical protein